MPEEGVRSPPAGVTEVNHLTWVLGSKPGVLRRAENALPKASPQSCQPRLKKCVYGYYTVSGLPPSAAIRCVYLAFNKCL